MFKRFFNQNPNQSFNNPNYNNPNYYMPNYDLERLQTELNESRRLISDLSKRVSRLESYLGINKDNNYYN